MVAGLRCCYVVARVSWEVAMQQLSGCQGILRSYYAVAREFWEVAMLLLGGCWFELLLCGC